MNIDEDKMPNNIVKNFGNSNSVTVPVNLAFNLPDKLKGTKRLKLMLAGFGVGLTWSGLVWDLAGLQSCDLIEYEEEA